MEQPSYVVVIPTVGRPSLRTLLDSVALATARAGYLPRRVVLADDRRDTPGALPVSVPPPLAGRVTTVTLEGRGPAAARNAGWRAAPPSEWVVFLDDDVRVTGDWAERLAADLAGAEPGTGGVQGIIDVPWPHDRKPADSQRATLALADAAWITADMAYRRAALADAGGFDERFPRAYREDADLALRVLRLGWTLRRGRRVTTHPVPPAKPWASIRAQAGNADDALMRRLHGPGWRARAGAATGRRGRHVATCVLGAAALGLAGAAALTRAAGGKTPPSPGGNSRVASRLATACGAAACGAAACGAAACGAAACGAGWLGLTAEFAARRILAGPRTWRETSAMAVTSAVIPPLAVWHWLRGRAAHRDAGPWPPPPKAVLFDRDGTLVHDVPYNGDPDKAAPVPGAAAAVAALRRAGVRVGMITNQSGIGRGILTHAQADAVNQRVATLVGPLDTIRVCPHTADDGCGCRKPAPGLVTAAAADLGVSPAECAVIGDIGADIGAARAAGARAILVPNGATRRAELTGVPRAENLGEAVTALLAGRPLPIEREAT